MKQKTKKSVAKRVSVSGGKKLTFRAGGQDHFNSRESGNTTRNKRRDKTMSKANIKNIKSLLPHA